MNVHQDGVTNNVVWTIHRPRQGWYLRLFSPSFPPGVFIPLAPPPPKLSRAELPTSTSGATVATGAEDGSLSFSVRTFESFPPPSDVELSTTDVQITVTEHSYPPNPPHLPSRSSSQTLTVPSQEQTKAQISTLPSPKSCMIRQFILTPSLLAPASTGAGTLFSRALSYITPKLPIRATYSFSLFPISPVSGSTSPLLTFTDRTSTFSVATTGLIEVNKGMERQLGINPSFWIALALAYLEFLADRDVSLSLVFTKTAHSAFDSLIFLLRPADKVPISELCLFLYPNSS